MATNAPTMSPLPTLFLLEAAATFFGGTILLVAPAGVLRASSNPSITYPMTQSSEFSPATIQILQWLGAFNYILCVPLILGAASNPEAKASRRIIYLMLGAGELFLTALMLWQLQGPDIAGAISHKSLLAVVAMLGSTVLARGWVLGFRSEWFEEARGPSYKRRSSNR